MTGYLFYPRADAAQDRIWQDTADRWGEAQAGMYITGLHRHLQSLSETPALWRRLPRALVVPADLRSDVFLSRYERHLIFFLALPSGKLGVLSLMHERMNIPVQLQQDLAAIHGKAPMNKPR